MRRCRRGETRPLLRISSRSNEAVMAEIELEPKRNPSLWPWILGLLFVLVVGWLLYTWFAP